MNQNIGLRIKASGVRKQGLPFMAYLFFFTFLIAGSCGPSAVSAADDPLRKMVDETISYFKPLTGKILSIEDNKVTVNIGAKDAVRKGMRFQVLREEAPFRHPVTGELLGELESLVGKLEVKEVGAAESTGEILEGKTKEGDKLRLSEIKVNVLFCQSKETDWHLAESYYRILKESGRFNLIDTSIDTDVPSKVIEEARRLRAEVALLLVAGKADSGTVLAQRLFWTSDGVQFSEVTTNIDAVLLKKIGSGDAFFKPSREDAWLKLDLPVDARHITGGDIDGDGKKEIVLDTKKGIAVYTIGADVQPAHGGLKIENPNIDNILWLDSVDLNGNGSDEIIITSMKGDDVSSYVYEFNGSGFVLLFNDKVFLRKLENGVIAQVYTPAEGFAGDVFSIVWDGAYKKGASLRLPKGVNIYDFVYIDDPRAGRLILAYDEDGFLNVFNSKDVKIWRSKTDSGGFQTSFPRKAPTILVDKGEWSVKDRLFRRNNEVLSVKRFPFVEMMKSLGFKKSQVRNLWWNGLSMQEGVLIDNIEGALFDYTVEGDKLFVLTSPLFGIKAENILKGENPLQTELFIYKMKGN
jgi:hypothetical protein